LTENWLNDIAPSAMFQVHERCATPPLSEFEHIEMRIRAMAHVTSTYGP